MVNPVSRQKRINEARARLAQRRAADPDAVQRYEARMARLSAAARRERERFETLVLGRDPEPQPAPKKPAGMSKQEWKREKARLIAARPQTLAQRWRHKAGTPETLEKFSKTNEGALARLHVRGVINDDQLAWSTEIAEASESIAKDVDVSTASLEARVDTSRSISAAEERLAIVRRHIAYTHWRGLLPAPKALVLDMLTGTRIGYTVAAARHRKRKADVRILLIEALDRWPEAKAWARLTVDQADLDRINGDGSCK